jgi:hypothetical protein
VTLYNEMMPSYFFPQSPNWISPVGLKLWT